MAQLIVFGIYVKDDDIKKEFLFCESLETTTKGKDIFNKISKYFELENLDWKKVCGVCTDGASAMLGSKSGFISKISKVAPEFKKVHCFIHRYALACKTLLHTFLNVLDNVIKLVNFIKSSALDTRLIKSLCTDLHAEYTYLLFYTSCRWLFKGNMLKRIYELSDEIHEFLILKPNSRVFNNFKNDHFLLRLAYLTDIFEQIDIINAKFQGKNKSIIDYENTLKAFLHKINNWKDRILLNITNMFPHLSEKLYELKLRYVLN